MTRTGSRLGRYIETSVGGERLRAFVPPPLPPDPALDLSGKLTLFDGARGAIGRLDGATAVLPSTELFLFMYVRKEALLSSQIEGTQSTLTDLLLFEIDEIPAAPIEDVTEVSNYVAAMRYGLDQLRSGFPLSLRLIRDMHGILLRSGRGASHQPGEFRRSQNWIGGTRPGNALFVPPPVHELMSCLDSFEKFLHARDDDLPTLMRAGLAHVQFETIHPFLDGNGRLGRLLITLMLCEAGLLREPVLYLSLHFKSHRSEYYRLLQEVREQGAWEPWMEFFLSGVRETANQAATTASEIVEIFRQDRRDIETLGRQAASALRVHEFLQRQPIIRVDTVCRGTGMTPPTVGKALTHLTVLGIVKELTGRRRNRVFSYARYFAALDRGTAPLSA
jgi:Fic family protein